MAEPVTVRDAQPAEFAAIGKLRVAAYQAERLPLRRL